MIRRRDSIWQGVSLALAALADYDWPGNVRELEHVLLRACVKAARRDGHARVRRRPQ